MIKGNLSALGKRSLNSIPVEELVAFHENEGLVFECNDGEVVSTYIEDAGVRKTSRLYRKNYMLR